MSIAKFGAVIGAGVICSVLSAATPAFAASPVTRTFMDNAMPNVDFLDRSSRLALDHTKNAGVLAFARSEATEQTYAVNDLYAWKISVRQAAVASADEEAGMITGRSVAIDGQQAPLVDMRLPLDQEDIDRLDGLADAEFDALYKEKQKDALTQIATDYKIYIAKGDDPVLLGIASRELPKVRRLLDRLGKI